MAMTQSTAAFAELEEENKLVFGCEDKGAGYLYAFYIYLNDTLIEKIPYSPKCRTVFWATLSGKYYAVVFVKNTLAGGKDRFKTNELIYQAEEGSLEAPSRPKKTVWENSMEILKETVLQFPMIFRLALFDYKLENQDTYLGRLWNILTPLIQIGTFWLVFGIGLRQGNNVGEVPFVIWMVCGLIPWFFINQTLVKGANSIYAKANTLSRMKFPLVTLPLERTLVEMFEHLMMLVILFIMLFCFGYYPNWHWFNLIYYIIYTACFLTGLSLITSVFTMFARDFSKLLQSLTRLLFYLTPILWDMGRMPEFYQKIMLLNPIYYSVTGFRESLLYEISFWESPDKAAFFWTINILLFLAGSTLQVKFRDQFIDLL